MKIKMTITIEYELISTYYDKGLTPEEMLKTDLENIKDDPSSFLDIFPHQITGEIVL